MQLRPRDREPGLQPAAAAARRSAFQCDHLPCRDIPLLDLPGLGRRRGSLPRDRRTEQPIPVAARPPLSLEAVARTCEPGLLDTDRHEADQRVGIFEQPRDATHAAGAGAEHGQVVQAPARGAAAGEVVAQGRVEQLSRVGGRARGLAGANLLAVAEQRRNRHVQVAGRLDIRRAERAAQDRRRPPRPDQNTDQQADGRTDRDVLDPHEPHPPAGRLDQVEEHEHYDREGGLTGREGDRGRVGGEQHGERQHRPERAGGAAEHDQDQATDDDPGERAEQRPDDRRAGRDRARAQHRHRPEHDPEPVLQVGELGDEHRKRQADGPAYAVAQPHRVAVDVRAKLPTGHAGSRARRGRDRGRGGETRDEAGERSGARIGAPVAGLHGVAAEQERPVGELAQAVGVVQLACRLGLVAIGPHAFEVRQLGATECLVRGAQPCQIESLLGSGRSPIEPGRHRAQRGRGRRLDLGALGGAMVALLAKRGDARGDATQPAEVLDQAGEGGGRAGCPAGALRHRDEAIAQRGRRLVRLPGGRGGDLVVTARARLHQLGERARRLRGFVAELVAGAAGPQEQRGGNAERSREPPAGQPGGDRGRVRGHHHAEHEREDRGRLGGGDVIVEHPREENREGDEPHRDGRQPARARAERAERDQHRAGRKQQQVGTQARAARAAEVDEHEQRHRAEGREQRHLLGVDRDERERERQRHDDRRAKRALEDEQTGVRCAHAGDDRCPPSPSSPRAGLTPSELLVTRRWIATTTPGPMQGGRPGRAT